ILPRGEIENLDHTNIPRLRQPVRASVFADRAARLRQLAQDHPLSTYLLLMADLAEAQGKLLKHSHMPGPDSQRLDLAQSHGMPPLQATHWNRDPGWRDLLASLLNHMSSQASLPPQALNIIQTL